MNEVLEYVNYNICNTCLHTYCFDYNNDDGRSCYYSFLPFNNCVDFTDVLQDVSP